MSHSHSDLELNTSSEDENSISLDSDSSRLNTPKIKPPRTSDDYLKLIMATQSMTTWDQFTASFADTFTPTKLLQIGGDKMDVLGWTNPRNFMVATNCVANFSNSDRQNSASGYNHATTLNGPGTGLTPVGWALFSLGPIAFFGGMFWEWGCNFEAYQDLSAATSIDRKSVLGYKSKGIVYQIKGGYGRVILSRQEPKIEELRNSDLVALRKDDQLTLYWIEDGKLVTRSFGLTLVQSIIDRLPETGKESTDAELIRNITSQYQCNQTMREKILADAEMKTQDFLDRKKVFNHLEQETVYASAGTEETLKEAYQTDAPGKIASLFTGKAALSEREGFFRFLFDFLGSDYDLAEPEVKRSWMEKIIVAMSLAAKRTWDFINNASFIYWLIFFSFASIVGMAAAASSPVFAPIIVGLTLGLTALYVLPRLISWVQNFFKSNDEIQEEKKENAFMGNEKRRMIVAGLTRDFIKEEHALDKKYLQDLGGEGPKKDKRDYDRNAPAIILDVEKDTVKNSRLGKYLLSGNRARFWLAIIIDAITAIVMTSFAFWIISAVTYVFAGAIALFTFFDSMFNSGIAGLLLGAFLAVRKYFDGTAAENNAEQCMEEELRKDYKGTGKTRLAVFEALENELEFEKAKVEWQRLHVLLKNVADDNDAFMFAKSTKEKFLKYFANYNNKIPTDKYQDDYKQFKALRIKAEGELHRQGLAVNEDALAREYDLDKIDVYNHQIFEKQQYQPTAWERVKQIGACAYTFLAGGQTGTLLARSLFLAGCVFGGIVASATGSLPIFLGIAITFAVLYGVARVAQFVLEDDRQKKENMYKNIDVRISYLVKKNKVVKTANNTLRKNMDNEAIKAFDKRVDEKQKQETPCEWIEKRYREAENYYKTMMKTTFFGSRSSFDSKAKVVNASDVNIQYVSLDSDSGSSSNVSLSS